MRKSIVGLLVPFMVFLGLLVVPNTSGAITVPGDERIADTTDPVLASVQFSKTFIPGKGVVNSVVLGRADKFPDNLGGSALAGADNGVMLLTDGGDRAPLRKEVRDEINRILTPNGANTACNDITANVYILGGTAAVSAAAESTLKSDGWCVFRLGGKTRIETALLIAGLVRKITGKFDFAMVARSDNPVDSAAAGALASKEGIPIVLSPTAAIDQTVLDFLFKGGNGTRFDVYMLGGTAALSAGVENKLIQGANGSNFPGTLVRRLSGNARDTTAIEIGKEYLVFNPNTSSSNVSVVVVNGYRDDTWVYALIAGALAWRENIVIYYVRDSKVDSPTCNFLGTLNPGPDAIKVLGPTSVVSKAAFDATRACAGPGGGTTTPTTTSPPSGFCTGGILVHNQIFNLNPNTVVTHSEFLQFGENVTIELDQIDVDASISLFAPDGSFRGSVDDFGLGGPPEVGTFTVDLSGNWEIDMLGATSNPARLRISAR